MELTFLAWMVVTPFVVLQIWAFIDVVRTPRSRWIETSQSQLIWVIVVLIPSAIGPILYILIARPRLLDGNSLS